MSDMTAGTCQHLDLATNDPRTRCTLDVDAEQPLLPLLLATAQVRDLTPEDFPSGRLPWLEQRQLIELSLAQGKDDQAHRLAIPFGWPSTPPRGGRTAWALRRWLKLMRRIEDAADAVVTEPAP